MNGEYKMKLSNYINVIFLKLKNLGNPKIKWSSIIFQSTVQKSTAIRQNTRLYYSTLGRYSYITRDSFIYYADIGNFCSIAGNVTIGLPEHNLNCVSTSPVFFKEDNYFNKNFARNIPQEQKRVQIGNDVWVGENAIILSGVSIGNGAVIAAGAVVTKNVPPYSIVGGVPAKIIRYRMNEKSIVELEKSKWWEWTETKLRNNPDFFERELNSKGDLE